MTEEHDGYIQHKEIAFILECYSKNAIISMITDSVKEKNPNAYDITLSFGMQDPFEDTIPVTFRWKEPR